MNKKLRNIFLQRRLLLRVASRTAIGISDTPLPPELPERVSTVCEERAWGHTATPIVEMPPSKLL